MLAAGLFVFALGQDRRPLAPEDDPAQVFPLPPRRPEAVAVAAFDRRQFQEPGIDAPDRLPGRRIHRQPAGDT